jgi:uncharacterized membrane protein YkvA (DUF1232 family)
VPTPLKIVLCLALSLLVCWVAPLDLVPDFIPVMGYADDAVIVVAVLRAVIKRAGRDTIAQHWPGSPDGLAAVERLAGFT